ncbi:centromere protein C isoform X2 [Ahaetulla prasina]|uniref:centromere protein C isoform X2 n=1 Tax=Ahaetulla prasina TaxID=499056 RepID=UPI002648C94B|nr:centromere protein C isoform X2 [Ahaetulla prasina]
MRRAGRSSGLKEIAMDSLNHLKTAYRPRFFNREGNAENATDIQGERVLECVHDCFETCTKQFIECSPTVSCDSSFNLNQVPCHSKEKEQTKLKFAKDNTFVSPDKMENFSGSKVSEEIKENDIEVCLGSPILLVENGEEGEEGEGEEGEKSCAEQLCFNEEGFSLSQKFRKSKGFSAGKEMEELCIEEPASKQIKMSGPMLSLNSATPKPEEECEFLIEEFFGLSSASWISISEKKQKPQKKKMFASFEGNEEAKKYNERRKNKKELEKTVMPTPLQEINTTLFNVGERSFDGFQNASRIKQVMAVKNNKSQLVRSFVTSQKTKKQMHSKNKYKDSTEICNRSYPISSKQAKGLISLLEADQELSVQIQPLEIKKQSLSQNKLTTLTKVEYVKQQDCTVLALSSKGCTQSKNTVIYSDNSDSISSFSPVAQQSCHNTSVKKPHLPSKKQSGIQKKKKRSPAGLGKKNRQLVSKGSLEDDHGEEHLAKKKNLHPSKLRIESERATSQKVRETSLPKPQNNVLYQEDSCEQHVAKKHSNISVTQQNNEGSLSHDSLLLPLCNNEIFKREWNPFNTDDSNSDKSADLEKNPVSNSLKHKLILPTNTPNVRRSKRIRMKPLEYWRGERIDYKINTSGDLVIGGIISPEQRESRKPKVQVGLKSILENDNLHDNSIFMEHFFQPAVVFDKSSNQQILLECVHNGSSPVSCFSNEILSIYKYLNTPSFASGKIILNPLKEKGYQYSHTDTLGMHTIYVIS